MLVRLVIISALALAASPARAQEPLSGTFTATAPCPAYQSISRQTNPGSVTLSLGQTYDLVAANKTPPTHFLVVVPGADPGRRWVELACGTTDAALPQPEEVASAPRPCRS